MWALSTCSNLTGNHKHLYKEVNVILGSFSIDDGDGRENVTFEINSRLFKLCRVNSSSLKMSNVGEFPWS